MFFTTIPNRNGYISMVVPLKPLKIEPTILLCPFTALQEKKGNLVENPQAAGPFTLEPP